MTVPQLTPVLGQPDVDNTPSRRRKVTLIAVLIGVLLAGSGWWIGRATAGTENPSGGAGLGPAHGPTLITNGIPHGYSRDATGAATAAINALQVSGSVVVRKIDEASAKSIVLATGFDEKIATQYFRAGVSDQILNILYAPMSVGVTTYTPDSATVRVWAVSIGATQNPTIPTGMSDNNFLPLHATYTIEVVWERGDWKIRSIDGANIENPLRMHFDDVPPWTGGAFTFLTQEGQ